VPPPRNIRRHAGLALTALSHDRDSASARWAEGLPEDVVMVPRAEGRGRGSSWRFIMTPVEMIGIVKPFALTLRLFANMRPAN